MHEYSPWWCAPTIWAGMCEQWKAESWVKRRRTAAVNRASGAPEGNKAPGTYKGGSISQLQHVAARVRILQSFCFFLLFFFVYNHGISMRACD